MLLLLSDEASQQELCADPFAKVSVIFPIRCGPDCRSLHSLDFYAFAWNLLWSETIWIALSLPTKVREFRLGLISFYSLACVGNSLQLKNSKKKVQAKNSKTIYGATWKNKSLIDFMRSKNCQTLTSLRVTVLNFVAGTEISRKDLIAVFILTVTVSWRATALRGGESPVVIACRGRTAKSSTFPRLLRSS